MTYAQTRIATRLAATAAVLAAPALCPQAQAASVAAGTLIENTASASFSAGGTTRTVDSNTVTVKVDELLDVALASRDSAPVSIAGGSAVLAYQLTNTGNGPEAFHLTANPAVSGNPFTAAVTAIAWDSNGNGVYDAGVDTVLASGAATPSIDQDKSLTVFVVVTGPGGMTDAETSKVNLAARAVTGSGTPGTAYAGKGQGGGDAVVGASGADADADGSLVASVATVALVKSAAIADPFGGSQPVPGASVTYTLVATIGGSGSIGDLRLTDVIPAGTSYTAGTLKLDAAALTDAADGDAGKASSSGIDVLVGTAAAGSTHTVTFNVTIQ
ncbi:DUF11 domain-containing protein [Sphingomonas sp. IC081]|uniref:DUF11 domain-containing protein n=1 Tax=Sphingomonas sp. IC081 TaxID=304378 RepID=UPI00115B2D67|nr:DUF11 domain-containing protein [Sphingomonas sp. IC081]QDK32172.1 hypothetical protein DM450_05110 [Sphingomonas sp. IC081]